MNIFVPQLSKGRRITNLFQCGGSGMFIPDPGSWFLPIPDPGSRIPDPKTATKERGEKKFCHTFLCSYKFHKIEHYFSFEVLKEKMWANFQRIIELFTQKIVTKLLKIWVWDPGSKIRYPEKTYSGSWIQDPWVKKAPDPGSGSATLIYSFLNYRRNEDKPKYSFLNYRWFANANYHMHVRKYPDRRCHAFFTSLNLWPFV